MYCIYSKNYELKRKKSTPQVTNNDDEELFDAFMMFAIGINENMVPPYNYKISVKICR